jgi:hypothetical protein
VNLVVESNGIKSRVAAPTFNSVKPLSVAVSSGLEDEDDGISGVEFGIMMRPNKCSSPLPEINDMMVKKHTIKKITAIVR